MPLKGHEANPTELFQAVVQQNMRLNGKLLGEEQRKCDPPYDFRDKGDNTLTTRSHLKTKEIDFNTLTKHARAHFNELVLLSHITH